MKKYRFASLFLLLSLALSLMTLPAMALEEPELHCTNAILVDVNYDEILYEKAAYDKAYPAVTDAIIAAQYTSVDTVSGATFSSQGLIDAVNDALSKIKK